MKEMQQEQKEWEVEQVPCSSDLLQFVQITAQPEVSPTVPFLLPKKPSTLGQSVNCVSKD